MSSFNLCLEKTDNSINNKINEVFSFFGIDHTGWYILKSVNEKAGILKQELFMLLRPLAASSVIHDLLIKYKIEGIIYEVEEKLILTTNGSDLFANCYAQQQLLTKKISHEDALNNNQYIYPNVSASIENTNTTFD